jgi:Na+/melibiose symporter-like transporter
MVASTAGLVGVTYGFIEAGRNSWTDASALAPMIAGLAVLVGFVLWEHRLSRRPGDQPLIDLALFRSASFTWGVVLAATAGLAMIGVLFALPQYFQGVLGTDAMGSGLRLLPLIGGLVAGAVPADRIARLVGAKITVALGFVLLAAGMLIGASTGVASGDGFVAMWTIVVGLGLGITFATAASAALSELSEERSGVGSAVMQALQKTGGPFGTAILGSVLSSAYLSQLHLTGLPAAVANAVRESLFGGLVVAGKLHSPALLSMVRGAFVHGMDVSLVVASGIAAVGILLALAFLPARAAPRAGGGAAVKAASSVTPIGPLLVGAANEEAAAERGEVEHDVVA